MSGRYLTLPPMPSHPSSRPREGAWTAVFRSKRQKRARSALVWVAGFLTSGNRSLAGRTVSTTANRVAACVSLEAEKKPPVPDVRNTLTQPQHSPRAGPARISAATQRGMCISSGSRWVLHNLRVYWVLAENVILRYVYSYWRGPPPVQGGGGGWGLPPPRAPS